MPATKSKRVKIKELRYSPSLFNMNGPNDLWFVEGFQVGENFRSVPHLTFAFCGIIAKTAGGRRKFYVTGGCRVFTVKQAREHWAEPGYSARALEVAEWEPDDYASPRMEASYARRRLPHIIRMVDAIEAEAIKRGWLRKKSA